MGRPGGVCVCVSHTGRINKRACMSIKARAHPWVSQLLVWGLRALVVVRAARRAYVSCVCACVCVMTPQMKGSADPWLADGPFAGLSVNFYVVAYSRKCTGGVTGHTHTHTLTYTGHRPRSPHSHGPRAQASGSPFPHGFPDPAHRHKHIRPHTHTAVRQRCMG